MLAGAALAILLAMGAGCEIIDLRPALRNAFDGLGREPTHAEQLRKKHYRTWPKPIQEACDDRRVLRGMDKIQVQVATGLNEALIRKEMTAAGREVTETWIVWKTHTGWTFTDVQGFRTLIIFQSDKVVEVRRD